MGTLTDLGAAVALGGGQREHFEVLARDPLDELRRGLADHLLGAVPRRLDTSDDHLSGVHLAELLGEALGDGLKRPRHNAPRLTARGTPPGPRCSRSVAGYYPACADLERGGRGGQTTPYRRSPASP